MSVSPLVVKSVVGGAVITSGAAATGGFKNYSNSVDFSKSNKGTEQNKVLWEFKDFFSKSLINADEADYDLLNSDSKEKWKTAYIDFYANKNKARSNYFYSFVSHNLFTETDKLTGHYNVQSRKDKAKEELKNKEDQVKGYIKDFHKACWIVSKYTINSPSHKTFWETKAKELINASEKDNDRLSRYFRDAWIGCSKTGSSLSIEEEWPFKSTIYDNENKSGWKDKYDNRA
ncbi:hypothetical protein MHSWG343_10880 [Candidatus Mycoplasma haematohominis]|uniref:Uncharacterized protein n=1 Tax=Candidatus Mycoplasma haematohominis TaxID=1494318 RepID=A0A478FVN9_9MOLU|nr:hypothetical protein MHSWG343_10880 [Candidatus Mycoplasma haemohominis]